MNALLCRNTLALRAALMAAAGTAGLTGCSSTNDNHSPATAGAQGSESLGAVGMKLTLLGGQIVKTVSWTITGPNGASTLVRSGNVDVSQSSTVSFTVGNLNPGAGYTVSLSGSSTDGTVTCTGSATFAITARATTNVSVLLQCNQPASEAGSANVNGTFYNCASAGGISASPSEAIVGNALSLAGTATGVNPSALAYAWSAPSGTFSAATSASTSFTCTSPGPVLVTLKVSDGPVPDGGACDASLSTASLLVTCDAASDAGAGDSGAGDSGGPASDGGALACNLGSGGAIKHVIYVQFDNTHLTRDRAAVPSDLEQMPHLLNFLRGNGTILANDHTILISHTAGGILTSLTGVYPDRSGQTVSNSYVRTSSTGSFSFPSSFAYWTDPAAASTSIPNMVGPDGSNIPAPWVSFTRSGCNVGAVASANIVLENTSTSPSGDVTKVFGAGSPQYVEAQASYNAAYGSAAAELAETDLVGFAVHCAQGNPICAPGEADLLPAEPGGYTGFQALFGAKQIDPILTGQAASVPLTDLLGNPITDSFGQPGFPGFDGMEAAVSLSYVAAMQEHGIPVTYAYISDAHDYHGVDGNAHQAYGPGSAGYVQQLAAYDQAFGKFFTRLAADGIDKTNTLFVFTVDEGDHFVGGQPANPSCDGVNTPCDWTNQVGEVNVNIDTLVQNEFPSLAATFLGSGPDAFTVHGDDAPTFYLAKKGSGPLSETDPNTRTFERDVANLSVVNPYTNQPSLLLAQMADQTGMKAFHMVTTGDPARNPTFAYFADPTYYITDYPSSTCLTCIQPAYAWNHGDIQPEIRSTWLGFVGPGVLNLPDQTVWTDHSDVRPTINAILGLKDTYALDGRAITQVLAPSAYSPAIAANLTTVQSLGDAYKQINAPFGQFALTVLSVSTIALESDDATYGSLEAQVASLVTRRDAVAGPISAALNAAEFSNTPIDPTQAQTWINAAAQLLSDTNALLTAATTGTDAGATGSDAGASDGGVDATTSAQDSGASVGSE